ncbi:DUF3040 domain-containing protein [Streptomyces sp. NPDC094472]
MAQPGIQPLHDIEAQTQRSAPQAARGPGTAHPRRPHAYRRRRGPAWVLLVLSLALLVMGMALPQGLLLAAGLVTAGVVQLFAPPHGRGRPLPRRRAPPRQRSSGPDSPGTKEDVSAPVSRDTPRPPRCGRS